MKSTIERPIRGIQGQPSLRRVRRGEVVALVVTLLAALVLRLALAARGWSYVNSDEATLGLMVDDILWHGAHPVFLYGQHYLGALQAYLAAPFFVLLGPTNWALHVVTTLQTLAFFVVLYAFTCAVYSRFVAWGTVALLALGPAQAVFFEMRAGAHAQDVLLFGSLLLALVVWRLRMPHTVRAGLALDSAIGVAIGLGLWGTFLIGPFAVAAALALGSEAVRRGRGVPRARWRRHLAAQGLALALGAGVALTPFIVATIASHGVIVHEVLAAARTLGRYAPQTSGVLNRLTLLGLQVLSTFLNALPILLGRSAICSSCQSWPVPNSTLTSGQVLRIVVVSMPFAVVAIVLWLAAARPVVRQAYAAWRSAPGERIAPRPELWARDARAWGRAMLVLGGGLTVVQFAITSTSYEVPDTASRYLVGLYLCTPLAADPLWQGARHVWRWLRAHAGSGHPLAIAWPGTRHVAATLVLLATLATELAGVGAIVRQSAVTQTYGVPAGTRDIQLLSFLRAQHITRFYTSYWVCYRLMFDAREQVTCSVISDDRAFQAGFNRVPAYTALLAGTANPAYLFDLTTQEVRPRVVQQVAARLHVGKVEGATEYVERPIAGYLVLYPIHR